MPPLETAWIQVLPQFDRLLWGLPGGPEEAASVLVLSRCERLLIAIEEQVDAQP